MPAPSRRSRRATSLVLALGLALDGCQAIRLYSKDLLDPRASAAVVVPVRVAIGLFALPPVLVWLPISIAPLLIFHDEPAAWFAIAPGLVIGGPFVLLAGTPGYLLTDKPGPDTAPTTSETKTDIAAVASADQAPSSSASPSGR